MKRTIDDLPLVRVATFVALGEIGRDAKTARVRFGDDGVEYQVGVTLRRFRNGGFWAMFVCPRCGGGSQRLRLLDGHPACGKRQGERVDLSFAVHPHREAPSGYSAAPPRQAQ
jgi:hypothetical protein